MNKIRSKLISIQVLSVVFLSPSAAFPVIPIQLQSLLYCSSSDSLVLQPRQEFSIPLVKIGVAEDRTSKTFLRVKILQDNDHDQSIITSTDDTYIKITTRGTQKTVYREDLARSYQISAFEADEINKVCKKFIQTLEIFEIDLKEKNFDRCRYLDSFLPRFLKGFMILLSLAKNSDDYHNIHTLLPETEYDVSVNSPKTDIRIRRWQASPEYVMKLRIITKELAYQLKEWQKNELSDSHRDSTLSKVSTVEETLHLFIKVYFNFPANIKSIKNR